MSARLRTAPLLVAAVIGVVLGVLSAWFDSLPVDTPLIVLVAMANAVGPWLVAAFAAGSVAGRRSSGALAGAVALIVGVVAYYVGLRAIYGDRLPPDALLAGGLWVAAAIGAGIVLGGAGGIWAAGGRRAYIGAAILAGGLIAEAAYRLIAVEAWDGVDLARTSVQVAIVDLVGALLAIMALVERRSRPAAFAWSAGLAVGGLALLSASLFVMDVIRFGGPA